MTHPAHRPVLVAVVGTLLAVGFAHPLVAQSYGPAPVERNHYEMYRGDALEVEVGKPASWTEVDGHAVAAQILEGGKVRIVAIRQGTATVTLKEGELTVWQAEVIVR